MISLTEKELQLLLEKYPVVKPKELEALFPGYTATQLKGVANRNGIKKKPGFGGKARLDNVQLDFLKKEYASTSNADLAKALGVSISSVTHYASTLGLKKSPEYLRSLVSERFLNEGVKTRFKPGDVSWNKGMSQEDFLTPEALEKVKKTQFKKGLVPHNHQPIGSERITKDGYIEVKYQDVSFNKNYILKHRLVWIQANGPIPKGMALEFIDGDKMNVVLENLRLISRKELLFKNQITDSAILKRHLSIKDESLQELVKNEYPQLIEAKRAQVKVNKQLNSYERCN